MFAVVSFSEPWHDVNVFPVALRETFAAAVEVGVEKACPMGDEKFAQTVRRDLIERGQFRDQRPNSEERWVAIVEAGSPRAAAAGSPAVMRPDEFEHPD